MAESFKALAAADLPQITPMLMSPLSSMARAEQLPVESLIYTVPADREAIVKLIVCSSDSGEEEIMLRCYSELGPIPLFGPALLGPREWAEWTGSLTLGQGAEIRGAVSSGSVSVAVYGMERAA